MIFSSRVLLFKKILSILIVFQFASCQQARFRTAEERIKSYENRARHYQTLSDIQRLSPPYQVFGKRVTRNSLYNPNLRMVYLQEARRYRKLAEEEKAQLESRADSNESGTQTD